MDLSIVVQRHVHSFVTVDLFEGLSQAPVPKTMHVTTQWKFARGWSDQHAICYLPDYGEKSVTMITQFKNKGEATQMEWFRTDQNWPVLFTETAEAVISEVDAQRAQCSSDVCPPVCEYIICPKRSVCLFQCGLSFHTFVLGQCTWISI